MQTAHSKFNLQMISNEFVQTELQITARKEKAGNLPLRYPLSRVGFKSISEMGPHPKTRSPEEPWWWWQGSFYALVGTKQSGLDPIPESSRTLMLGWVTPPPGHPAHWNTWNFHFPGRWEILTYRKRRQDTKEENRGVVGIHNPGL